MNVDQMTDILEIKPLIPPTLWPLLLTLALILLVLGGIIFYFLKRKKKTGIPVPVKVVSTESPKEKALRKLGELNASGLLERHQYRKYYFGLSEILRAYIEEQYQIEAVEATTEELLPRIKIFEGFLETQKVSLIFLFQEMDLVKFAKMNPSSESLEKVRHQLREFIEN